MLAVNDSIQGRLPEDLQRLIFEGAARTDSKTARRLVLVARHVRTWIEPILCECVIVRTQQHASALLETINAKPQAFRPIVKSLAIGDSVTLQQSKAILAECSQNVANFAVWANARNPAVFLPFIRSHSVRQLTLKSHHPSELSFPPTLLTSLTHLTLLGGPYSWFQMRDAARHVRRNSDPDRCDSVMTQFHSLTHFAVCSQNWGSMQPILKVAPNLRCFVVVVPPQFKHAHVIAQRIQETGDRRIVLVEYEQTIEDWEDCLRGTRSSIWERAEKLVESDRFTDLESSRIPRIQTHSLNQH
ncbi:hypothetical protein H0H92_001576 [Tricholoma furcatifolium]|nr:hypothetical protein H0H92_001576 [Tricholoma furcatifolium]